MADILSSTDATACPKLGSEPAPESLLKEYLEAKNNPGSKITHSSDGFEGVEIKFLDLTTPDGRHFSVPNSVGNKQVDLNKPPQIVKYLSKDNSQWDNFAKNNENVVRTETAFQVNKGNGIELGVDVTFDSTGTIPVREIMHLTQNRVDDLGMIGITLAAVEGTFNPQNKTWNVESCTTPQKR